MKNYNSIDLTKFILSIFVITIHCYIVPTIQQPLLRDICMMIQYTAVPLFFCFTGYFLFRRVLLAPEGAKKNIKRAWLRFGKLYLIWFIIYSVIIDGQGGGGGGVWGGGGKFFKKFMRPIFYTIYFVGDITIYGICGVVCIVFRLYTFYSK